MNTAKPTAVAPPEVGLGLWKIDRPAVAGLIEEAARVGYRHFDSACDYGNEPEAGQGIRRVLHSGLCRRDQLWVTSKLWNTFHAPEHVRPACERTLRDLGLDHLDLYLVHFPIALAYVPPETRYPPGWFFDPDSPRPGMRAARVPLADTWGAMEDLVQAGLVRHVGVCNYGVSLLRDLLASARIRPAVLQVELHPYLTQEKLLRFCREEGIAVTAFSPLGAPSYVPLGMAMPGEGVLEDPVAGGAAVGGAAGHGRNPEDLASRAASGKPRDRRFRSRARADGGDLGARPRPEVQRSRRLLRNRLQHVFSDLRVSGAARAPTVFTPHHTLRSASLPGRITRR
jgi:D-xylose reductase